MKSFNDYAKILEELYQMDNAGTFINFEEVQELDHKVTQEFVIPLKEAKNEKWFDNDELLAEYGNIYSYEGFINGFICAMNIVYHASQKEAKAV